MDRNISSAKEGTGSSKEPINKLRELFRKKDEFLRENFGVRESENYKHELARIDKEIDDWAVKVTKNMTLLDIMGNIIKVK